MIRGVGTAINVVTVVTGTAIGVGLGHRIPAKVREVPLHGVGLLTLVLGARSFSATHNAVFPVVAIIVGGAIGALLDIESRLQRLGERLHERFARDDDVGFVQGFVDSSLLFCVGPMTILGSLQDGIHGQVELLAIKGALDGLVAIVYATSSGIGVGFSALVVAVVQGTITLFGAMAGDSFLTPRMVAELEAAGGVMIVGIGLRVLDLKHIPVASLLPALVIAPVLVALFAV